MIKFNYIVILGLILGSLNSNAQDAFFSHFNYSNAQTNPAQASISEDVNIRLLHRSQWMGIVAPFSTSQFEGSFPLRNSVTGNKYAAVGISFVNDRLGEGGYLSTNQFAASFSYDFGLNHRTSHIALGLKAGYFNGSTSLNSITTSSQWNGASYDPTAGLGEDVSNPLIKGAEISPGFMWYQNDSLDENKFYFGVSTYNVIQPKTGVVVEGFGLPMRITATGGATFFPIEKFSIAPKLLFMLQGTQTQAVFGTDWLYHLERTKEKRAAIGLGTYYRAGDSFIAGVKYLSNIFDVGVSYDISTSGLTDGLNTNTGSLEIFLNYKIASKKSAKPFQFNVEVYDADTKELILAKVKYKSLTTGKEGIIINDKSKGTTELHVKEEYVISAEKDGYIAQTINLKQPKEEDKTEKIYLEKLFKTFDLDLQSFDKATSEPVIAKVYLVDAVTGTESLLGEGNSLNTPLEIGKEHQLIVRSDGFDDEIIKINYDKFGTLNKPVYLNKSFVGAYLKLIVIDEDTKKVISSTVMVSDITIPATPINALMVMNDITPETYPLNMDRKFEILITKEGYFNQSIKIDVTSSDQIDRTVELSALGVGKSIVLDDLLFKTGKAELDQRSFRLLDQMVDFLNQNPNIKIEIGGHTDNIGSDGSNQRLSEARANSAVDYIANKGIGKGRLQAKGYGEAKPRADNGTDDGKALNRRVEMKVTGT
jgi:type IX secretion system PorP/SprF family membrane protein